MIGLSIADSLYDNNHKLISKLIELGSLIMLSNIAYITGETQIYPFWLLLIVSTLVRFGVFNITYNITRRLPLTYVGTTDIFDKLLSKVPPALRPLYYVISLAVSFGLLFNY